MNVARGRGGSRAVALVLTIKRTVDEAGRLDLRARSEHVV